MRLALVSFGLLSVFMLVSSLPLGPATSEKRRILDSRGILGNFLPMNDLPLVGGLLGGGSAPDAAAPAPPAAPAAPAAPAPPAAPGAPAAPAPPAPPAP